MSNSAICAHCERTIYQFAGGGWGHDHSGVSHCQLRATPRLKITKLYRVNLKTKLVVYLMGVVSAIGMAVTFPVDLIPGWQSLTFVVSLGVWSVYYGKDERLRLMERYEATKQYLEQRGYIEERKDDGKNSNR